MTTTQSSPLAGKARPLTVAVIVPVRNEMRRLPALLDAIRRQTYPPVEVIVADGSSTDGSRAWLEQASAGFPALKVVDNPDRVIPAALNRAFSAASADVVARMDAHAVYDDDYLERLVDLLADRPDIAGAGGSMRTVGEGAWGGAIAAVLSKRWALGGAPHRVGGERGPVDHVFCTAYRREAVERAGGWDSRLLANEDAEMDFRIAREVGPVWLEPSARSSWTTRTSPVALARQMARYGFYRARTVWLHPSSLRRRHLVPVALVAGLPVLVVTRRREGVAATAAYLAAAGALGAASSRSEGASAWRGAVALPVVHLSWGAGMLVGLIRHRGAQPAPGVPVDAGNRP